MAVPHGYIARRRLRAASRFVKRLAVAAILACGAWALLDATLTAATGATP